MKLSDFLKQQGDTPQGKSVYQAFIDNFDKDYDAGSFRKDEKGSITDAFQWGICPEDYTFWDIVDNKWQEVTDPENDMLWLLDGKEPPQEADVEDELEERRRKEAVTPTEQTPILPIGTNKLLDKEETKELDETVKAADPSGYFEEPEKKPTEDDIPLLKTVKEPYVSLADMKKIVAEATQKAYSAGYLDGEEAGRKSIEIISVASLEEFNGLGGVG